MTIVRTVTPAGEAIVILPEAEFDRLRDLAADALDARTIDASLDRLQAGEDELLTEPELDALRRAPTPLAFWRAKRALPLEALAHGGGVPADRLASLEAGTAAADAETYGRLARVLGVEPEDITP